ncbi:MAG: 4Fe-4S binding protein [Clostridia bacterium]|nr:4Fe-4S binding protein [Clostridia bacterium]
MSDLLKDVERDGVVKWEDVEASEGCPSADRMASGAVAVIECLQEIPCNPCETGCPFGAISVGDPITRLPRLDEAECRGCGVCVAACPGLAIFIEDSSGSGDEGKVTIPFEYIPVPLKGARVRATDRQGREICDATVVDVKQPKVGNKTAVVTISVPKRLVHEARGIAMSW